MKKQDFDPRYYGKKYATTMTELEFSIEGLNMPAIDPANIGQVMDRSSLYFQRCNEEMQEPGVAGLCVWLGITTERWKMWVDGAEYGGTHRNFCERIMTLLEARLEGAMMRGEINPVTAMFLLKTQHNYNDTPAPKKAHKQQVIKDMPVSDILKLINKK